VRRQRFIAAGESNNDAIIAKDSNQRSVGLCLAAASCEAILSGDERRGETNRRAFGKIFFIDECMQQTLYFEVFYANNTNPIQ
jgi:hypothetical protein